MYYVKFFLPAALLTDHSFTYRITAIFKISFNPFMTQLIWHVAFLTNSCNEISLHPPKSSKSHKIYALIFQPYQKPQEFVRLASDSVINITWLCNRVFVT